MPTSQRITCASCRIVHRSSGFCSRALNPAFSGAFRSGRIAARVGIGSAWMRCRTIFATGTQTFASTPKPNWQDVGRMGRRTPTSRHPFENMSNCSAIRCFLSLSSVGNDKTCERSHIKRWQQDVTAGTHRVVTVVWRARTLETGMGIPDEAETAKAVRLPQDRLKGLPQEGQHSTGNAGTRDRQPPARGAASQISGPPPCFRDQKCPTSTLDPSRQINQADHDSGIWNAGNGPSGRV